MKQKSKFFLVYSIALFSVALILILFSSFMGIRNKEQTNNLSNNIQALQDQNETLSKEKAEKETENSELLKQIDILTNENKKLTATVAIMQLQSIIDSEEPDEEEALNGKLEQIKDALDEGRISDAQTALDSFTEEEKEVISLLSDDAKSIFEQIGANIK